jgi:hypothetical protein
MSGPPSSLIQPESTWGQCYDFENIFTEKMEKFLAQITAMYLGSKHEPTYAFQEKRHFAENW